MFFSAVCQYLFLVGLPFRGPSCGLRRGVFFCFFQFCGVGISFGVSYVSSYVKNCLEPSRGVPLWSPLSFFFCVSFFFSLFYKKNVFLCFFVFSLFFLLGLSFRGPSCGLLWIVLFSILWGRNFIRGFLNGFQCKKSIFAALSERGGTPLEPFFFISFFLCFSLPLFFFFEFFLFLHRWVRNASGCLKRSFKAVFRHRSVRNASRCFKNSFKEEPNIFKPKIFNLFAKPLFYSGNRTTVTFYLQTTKTGHRNFFYGWHLPPSKNTQTGAKCCAGLGVTAGGAVF